MNNRHINELTLRLERVADYGFEAIMNAELARWYQKERIGRSVWRDIAERWDELETGNPLLVAFAEGRWLFVNGQGLKVEDSGWWNEVGAKAARDTA